MRGFEIFLFYSAERIKRANRPRAKKITLRSELWRLFRIARIARPGALCDASVSAQTFETSGEKLINPSDSDEIADVDLAKMIRSNSHSHIPCFDELSRKPPMSPNRVNLTKKIKRSKIRKPILMYII